MQKQTPRAAGILIAVGAIAGFTWGLFYGQPNWWALAGTLIGIVLAVLIWLADRRKS